MDIPSGVIIMWPSSAGSIPSGWTRETGLDGKFIVGTASGTNPNNTGGADNHNHSQPSHSHSGGSHTHMIPTYKRGTSNNGPYNLTWQQWDNQANGYSNIGYGSDCGGNSNEHTHGAGPSAAGTNNLSSSSQSWGTSSNLPTYYETIFIKSGGSAEDFPNGSSTFWSSSSVPDGWSLDSNVGDRFLRGASGSNSGGTGGGSHSHNTSSHTHSASHSHGGFATDPSPYSCQKIAGGGCDAGGYYELGHNHGTTPSLSGGGNSGGGGGSASGSTSPVPKYKKQIAIKNGSGSADYPSDGGAICMWLGTLSNIPEDWLLCDGSNDTPDMRDYFGRGTSSTGNVGASANSSTSHNHGTSSHSHSGSHNHGNYGTPEAYNPLEWGAHAYAYSIGCNSAGRGPNTNVTDAAAMAHGMIGHIGGATGSGDGGTSSNATQSISSANQTPAWRTVAFIFSPEDAAGGNMAMFGSSF